MGLIDSLGAATLALLAAAATLAIRFWMFGRAERARDRFAPDALLAQFSFRPPKGGELVRSVLLALAVGALVLAAGSARQDPQRTDPQGAETVIVLDASNSMLALDVAPDRLTVQRDLAVALSRVLPGRVGIVYFAGRAYVLAPLTTDGAAVEMFVEGVRPSAVGLGGSALASGITQALDLLAGGEDDAAKSVVLFSDGEETVGQPLADALDRAAEAGIPVHTVGVGTREGGRIPITRDASVDPAEMLRARRGQSYLLDRNGQEVVTRLEDETLREISSRTGGRYFDGQPAAVDRLVSTLGDPSGRPVIGRDPTVSLLLVFAFLALWGEAFLIPRG